MEPLNVFELLQIRSRGLVGFFVLIVLLFGHDFFLNQIAPAVGRHFGYLFLRPRLCELLVDLGRCNLRQQLPGVHVIADINLPAFHVTVGAWKNCRLVKGLEGTGQN